MPYRFQSGAIDFESFEQLSHALMEAPSHGLCNVVVGLRTYQLVPEFELSVDLSYKPATEQLRQSNGRFAGRATDNLVQPQVAESAPENSRKVKNATCLGVQSSRQALKHGPDSDRDTEGGRRQRIERLELSQEGVGAVAGPLPRQ